MLAENIRKLRKENGLTQTELGDKLGFRLGFRHSTIENHYGMELNFNPHPFNNRGFFCPEINT